MTTQPTYNHIPALRFPEFQNEGEWEEAKVGDVLKTITPPKKLNSSEYKKTGKYPIIDQSQSYICGYSDDEDALMNHNNEDLIVFGDHTCVLKFVSFPFIQGADGIKIIKSKDSNKLVESFLFQSLLNNPVASGEYKRHFSELKEKEFCFSHSIAEQQKMASCLFSMDAYISATKEKLEQLKAYKKGLMQKLFPVQGKTLPEYRFKEFEKDGEWEVKKLGDCFTERIERNCCDLPLLSLTESDGIVLQEETNRKNNSNADKSNYLRVCVGDIAYNTMRMWQGRCAWVSIEGIVSPAYTICKPNEKMDSLFFFYLFKTPNAIELFHRNSQGLVNDTLNLKYESFEKIKMCVPTYFEQRKIASCLSVTDQTINTYTEKVAQLKEYKKGLMQQMFPNSL